MSDLIKRLREAAVNDSDDPCSLHDEAARALEAAQKDAERYRWLRQNHALWMLYRFPPQQPWDDSSAVIDEAIDAAIEASKKGGAA